MDTMLTYNTNSKTGPVCGGRAGVQFNYIAPIISPYSGYLFQAWGAFYKHSAYFLDKSIINKDGQLTDQKLKPFEYNPYLSMEYYVQTKEPEWGVDFDEAQGGLGILSKNFKLNFGKFKSSLGPFHRGNLSLSLKSPSFPQIKLSFKKDFINDKKINFTYFIGDLISEITSDTSPAYINEELVVNSKFPWIKRGVVHHRIDFHLTTNFRIGFYEQLIYGARQTPWQYLIPINFYWSAQHATGDFDNLQMGFDIDWIHHKGRTNIAFLMDEWAPFKTFNSENHHNWFAVQLGHTQIFDFIQQPLYFRFESTIIAPQTYEHKFPINQAFNQGYPIGYWTKGDAADFWIVLTWLNDNKLSPRIELEYTILGEPKYGVNRRFLQNKKSMRAKSSLIFDYKLQLYSHLELQLSYFKNQIIEYDRNEFFDCTISYKYNITF